MKLRNFNNKKMNAPRPENLINQCFNSERIEFVWQFPMKNELREQFILQVQKNTVIFMETGIVDTSGNYIEKPTEFKLGYGHLNPEGIITTERNWPGRKFPSVYKNFTNGRDLIPLIKEMSVYLQSL